MAKKNSLNELTMRELLEYEDACKILCSVYDNISRRYDNTLMENSSKEVNNVIKYSSLRNDIILEIENRLNKLL